MKEKNSTLHAILLFFLLCVVWYFWSGKTGIETKGERLILYFGLGSVLTTLWVSKRLQVVDEEGQPLNARIPVYLLWLVKEIIVANIDVIGRILSTKKDAVYPTWIRVPAKQKTRLGKVIFANSITLTPGTVSVEMEDGSILVNAVSKEGAESLIDGGEMGAKVCALEADND